MMEHKNLTGALLKAKTQMGKLLKDSKNPHFKSSYASLAAVIDVITAPLLEAGIVLVESPVPDAPDGTVAIDATLFHPASGESITYRSSPMPVAQRTPQGIGSAITYARRYHLMTVMGLAPEDDDGNDASHGQQRRQAAPPVQRRTSEHESAEVVTPVTPAPTNGNGHETPPLISDAQLKMLHTLGTKFYGAEWEDKRPQLVGYITGGRTVSSKQLTVIEATKLLDGLRKKIDERDAAAAEAEEDDVFDGAGPHDTEPEAVPA
jgi:hypothetical protein